MKIAFGCVVRAFAYSMCFVCLTACNTDCDDDKYYAVSDEFISEINHSTATWTAGRNFNADREEKLFKYLVGGLPRDTKYRTAPFHPNCSHGEEEDGFAKGKYLVTQVPEAFDGRVGWNDECTAIVSEVGDTGFCASSWAMSVTQAMQDRHCISNHGISTRTFSTKEILDCCAYCRKSGDNCNGGNQQKAYEFFKRSGVPTGRNDYDNAQGCKPYSIPPSWHCLDPSTDHNDYCEKESASFSESCSECTNEGYSFTPVKLDSYKKVKTETYSPHGYVSLKNVIKEEILHNGSVTADVTVYDDFLNYRTGVYSPTPVSNYFGDLTLRLIGWGTETGQEYWLAANVWGSNWGDRGFVKLQAWDDRMNIETRIFAGVVRL